MSTGAENTEQETLKEEQELAVPEPEGEEIAPATEEQPVEPEYVPNYEYSVLDEKKEFDEFIRESIKNKEHEDAMRDLYTKANGLDPIKKDRDELKTTNQQLLSGWQRVEQLKGAPTYDDLFSALDLDEDRITEYVMNKARAEQLRQLSPDSDVYNNYQTSHQQREAEKQRYMVEQQNQQLMKQNEDLQYLESEREVTAAMASPEFSEYTAKIPNFRHLVIAQGVAAENRGEQVPAMEAARRAVNDYLLPIMQAQQPTETQQQPVASTQRPPTLPQIKGGANTSPVQKRVKSIEDIRKIQQEYLNR